MNPRFLHLEDHKQDLSLKRIKTSSGLSSDPDVILTHLHDFFIRNFICVLTQSRPWKFCAF